MQGLDLIGPLHQTEAGNIYIFTATDYFTKWVEAWPIPDKTAISVAGCMAEMFYRHGASHSVITDQGREFVNEVSWASLYVNIIVILSRSFLRNDFINESRCKSVRPSVIISDFLSSSLRGRLFWNCWIAQSLILPFFGRKWGQSAPWRFYTSPIYWADYFETSRDDTRQSA